jgi:hypothetical protein
VFYDREEATAAGSAFVISPNPPVAAFTLCGETSVLTFNAANSVVLGGSVAQTSFTTKGFTSGWANVATPGLTTGNALVTNVNGNGLPILGKAYSRASNPQVSAGIAANFGASWEHRTVRPNNP